MSESGYILIAALVLVPLVFVVSLYLVHRRNVAYRRAVQQIVREVVANRMRNEVGFTFADLEAKQARVCRSDDPPPPI